MILHSTNSSRAPAQDAFLAQMEVLIKKKASMKVTVNEEWLSEKEMRDDYNWSALLG